MAKRLGTDILIDGTDSRIVKNYPIKFYWGRSKIKGYEPISAKKFKNILTLDNDVEIIADNFILGKNILLGKPNPEFKEPVKEKK